MRSLFFAALLALAIGAAACSGGGSKSNAPKGEHHHYAVDGLALPTSNALASQFALDLDGDAIADNAFGSALAALSGATAIDFQGSQDDAIRRGTTLLLADLQAPALDATGNVGFATFHGANPTPSPCANGADTVCGHHLDGTGTFDIAPGSPTDAFVSGSIASGQFTDGAPGSLVLSLNFLGTAVDLQLEHARAKFAVASSSLNGVIAGVIPTATIQTQLLPAFQAAITNVVMRDCSNVNPPSCGCLSGSAGESLIQFFDTTADCAITLAEVQSNGTLATVLAPDIDTDGDGANDGISCGVGFAAVPATFTQP